MEAYKPKVKICCISSLEEANMALAYGADVLGLVGPMPSGPGIISDELIREIATQTPPALTFLLTSETEPKEIIRHCLLTATNCVQLVDAVSIDTYAQIRAALPYLNIIQVIHVTGDESIDEAKRIAPFVDAVLLDSGNPSLQIKELGGTGRVHDWTLSAQIREAVRKPVFLAGGLHAANVAEAIRVVKPYGLDLCSGVRTSGKLDPIKLAAFMAAVAQAAI